LEARYMDAMEVAWGVIATASHGDWSKESPEWREVAERWRDDYWHPLLEDYIARKRSA
jgi:hypothetical protein